MIPRPNLLDGENLPPAPRQRRSQDKQLRLKRAGLALFGEQGYNLTSIDEIAQQANFAVGTFYQHFRSKRQLLLVLMDDLLLRLSRVDLRPKGVSDVRAGLRLLLSRAIAADFEYFGAYRAWQEAAASDTDLALKQAQIHTWTKARVMAAFEFLQQLPGARGGVDLPALAEVMDSFFWNLLAQAASLNVKPTEPPAVPAEPVAPTANLNRWIDSSTHLIYHALFTDPPPAG